LCGGDMTVANLIQLQNADKRLKMGVLERIA
jgi:hypothetical protein